MKTIKSITAEAWLTGAFALIGVLGILFMSDLVAKPKALLGRTLTAIEPSLFPLLVLGALALLACGLLFTLRGSLLAKQSNTFDEGAVYRVVALFAVMFFYALTMAKIGFFISTLMSLAAIAWIAGNRSLSEISAVSIISPIALYLVATRGLAVSLPELSSIEFLYARILNATSAVITDPAVTPQ